MVGIPITAKATSCPYNIKLYVFQLVTLTVCVSTLFYQACTRNSNYENTLWNRFLDVL